MRFRAQPRACSSSGRWLRASRRKKAEDGPKGGNGIFAGARVRAMKEPDLKIEEVFKKTVVGVRDKTGNL